MTLVFLKFIRDDVGTQTRAGLDMETVEEYARLMSASTPLPPITLVQDGETYWIVDGWHRVAAARMVGARAFDAIVSRGTREDAIWKACAANQAHGLKRTNADKRRAVELALQLKPEMSNRALADHVGVSDPFVASVRRDTEPPTANGSQLAPTGPRTGLDGKTRRMPERRDEPPTEAQKPEEAEGSAESDDEPGSFEPEETGGAGIAPSAPPPRRAEAPEPVDLIDELQSDPGWAEARAIYSAAVALLKAIKDRPAFRALRRQDAEHGIKTFAEAFKLAKPEMHCPRKGKHDERCTCKGERWLPHSVAVYEKKRDQS